MDYRAITFSIQTQCSPISTRCNLNAYYSASTPYYCTSAFQGDVTQDPWEMTYFMDGTMTNNITSDYGISNPYYLGWAVLLNRESGFPTTLENDPDVIQAVDGGAGLVLGCNVTLYDVEYESVNATITRFVTRMSNASAINILQLPMALTVTAQPYLQQYASLAAFSGSGQEIADNMALSYSKAALSVFAGTLVPAPAIAARERTSTIVARIPQAPLFALIGANLLFCTAGIVLLGITLCVPSIARETQARLSITGLAAHVFESVYVARKVDKVEQLFEENDGHQSVRVYIVKSQDGGYEYKQTDHHDN